MFSTWGDIADRFRRISPLVIVAAIVALFAVFGTQLGDRMSQKPMLMKTWWPIFVDAILKAFWTE